MASEKIMNFVEEIKKLSVLELSELVDAIQEEFGVTAAVAAAVIPDAASAESFPAFGSASVPAHGSGHQASHGRSGLPAPL